MSNSISVSGNVSFAGLLTIVFIVLRLIHEIAWSWWWVLSPLWISAAVVIFAAILMFVLAFATRKFRQP